MQNLYCKQKGDHHFIGTYVLIRNYKQIVNREVYYLLMNIIE